MSTLQFKAGSPRQLNNVNCSEKSFQERFVRSFVLNSMVMFYVAALIPLFDGKASYGLINWLFAPLIASLVLYGLIGALVINTTVAIFHEARKSAAGSISRQELFRNVGLLLVVLGNTACFFSLFSALGDCQAELRREITLPIPPIETGTSDAPDSDPSGNASTGRAR